MSDDIGKLNDEIELGNKAYTAYESYIKDLKNFSLSINGETVYDSSIDKTGEHPVKFENDYFILYGKKYSYNGLRVQKINKR